MFGLFKKKESSIPVEDRIWMHESGKWQACLSLYHSNPRTVFLGWFEESRSQLRQYFESGQVTDALVQDAGFAQPAANPNDVVFIEHYPVATDEQEKFKAMGLPKAVVLSALSEPLFDAFGGGRVIDLMKKMDIKEDEMIQHSLVTASIKKAQEKIASKAIISGAARSQRDWLMNAGIGHNEN